MSSRGHLLVALVSTLLAAYVAFGWLGMALGDSAYTQLSLFNEVLHIVFNSYVEPVDVNRALNGARFGLTEALDGDSAYLNAADLRVLQQPKQDGDIGLVLTRRLGFLMVIAARKDSPADRAILLTGDILKTIEGKHTRTLSTAVGEKMLQGAPGSIVKLVVLRAGKDPLHFAVVREKITPAVPIGRMLDNAIGCLKIPELTAGVAEIAAEELATLRRDGARQLVLDLRGAAFGDPQEAVKIAALFMQGAVGRLAGRSVREQVLSTDATQVTWQEPLVVLVDAGTAQAAEILAAALLDSKRADLVGRPTFGRAAQQKLIPLEDGALILTVAQYMRPDGTAIHGAGIEPSVRVTVPSLEEGEAGMTGDPILEKGVEVLLKKDQKSA